MCMKHPFVPQSQTHVARSAAHRFVHTHKLELLSHYPVGLMSNQIVVRISCFPQSFELAHALLLSLA